MGIIKKDQATIADVAKKAQVSTTTVSRYLNGKFEYMSQATRELIKKVIEELNYRPSNIARSLKSQKTGTVGCVIADVTNPFSSYIVKGINDVCRKHGYQVVFSNTDNNEKDEIECIQSLLDGRLDGLIVNTTGYIDDLLVDLSEKGLPIVLADRCLKNRYLLDTITTNNYDATFDCMKFLYNQGYKKVAFFTQDLKQISSRYIRKQAYLDAMAKIFDIDGEKFTYVIDIQNKEECRAALKELKEKCPDEEIAIFAVNGVTLLCLLQSMQEEGFKTPDDFGVCGFDDWGWASLIGPGITTISQDSYKTGVKSAQLLIKRIHKEYTDKKKYTEIAAKLTVRGSTTPLAGKPALKGEKNEHTKNCSEHIGIS